MTTILKQAAAGVLLAGLFTVTVIAATLTMKAEDMLSTPAYAPTVTQPTEACSPPGNWVAATLLPDVSFSSLAAQTGLREEALRKANCLARNVQPGDVIYIPPSPRGVTPLPCGPPPGWHLYTVKENISLEDLAQRFDLTIELLQEANCFYTNFVLHDGERLFVPSPDIVTLSVTISPSETLTPEIDSYEKLTPTITLQP